jgi:hypothetical protein
MFPYYLINGMIFRGKKLLNVKCVFWFALKLWYETFITLNIIQLNIVTHVKKCFCKVCVLFPDFDKTLVFFSKILEMC